MRLDDRLAKDSLKKQDPPPQDLYYAEEPDWYIYDERKRQPYMNKNVGVFEVTDERALNTEKSVFDRQAVFNISKTVKGAGTEDKTRS